MRKHWKLIVYLLGFLILTVTLAAAQPLKGKNAPPDEVSRYLVPQYICEHGALPTGLEEEIRIPGYGFSYALYNAFPYIVMGLAMRLVSCVTADAAALLLTARLVNVLAGLAMAYVVYELAKRLFSAERSRWLFCLAVAYQPMNLFVHSYVNTDSFCMLSTAMIVYGLVRLYREGVDVRICLWLAAGVSLCALSYYSAYGYILAAMILFVAYFAKKDSGRFDRAGFLKYGALTAVLVLLGIGWWFIRQGIVLQGDFLGLRTRDELVAAYGKVRAQAANTYAGKGYSFFGMIGEMIAARLPLKLAGTLIAAYGTLNIRPQVWFYALYALVWSAGVVGCVMKLAEKGKPQNRPQGGGKPQNRPRGGARGRQRFARPQGGIFHGCMVLCMVLPLVLYLSYCYATDYQEQGRYLLPALVPAMMYLTKGLERLGKRVVWCASAVIVFCAFWQVFAVALPVFGLS